MEAHDEAPEHARIHPGPGGSTRSPRTSASRTSGRCRRRAAATTSRGSCSGWPRAMIRRGPPLPRRPRAVGDPPEGRASCSAGTARMPGSASGCPRSATGCRQTFATPRRARTSGAPVHLAVPAPERVGRGDRQPHSARRHARRLGPGRDRRLPRPDGRLGEAKRTARERLHGRDQAVPPAASCTRGPRATWSGPGRPAASAPAAIRPSPSAPASRCAHRKGGDHT